MHAYTRAPTHSLTHTIQHNIHVVDVFIYVQCTYKSTNRNRPPLLRRRTYTHAPHTLNVSMLYTRTFYHACIHPNEPSSSYKFGDRRWCVYSTKAFWISMWISVTSWHSFIELKCERVRACLRVGGCVCVCVREPETLSSSISPLFVSTSNLLLLCCCDYYWCGGGCCCCCCCWWWWCY